MTVTRLDTLPVVAQRNQARPVDRLQRTFLAGMPRVGASRKQAQAQLTVTPATAGSWNRGAWDSHGAPARCLAIAGATWMPTMVAGPTNRPAEPGLDWVGPRQEGSADGADGPDRTESNVAALVPPPHHPRLTSMPIHAL